MTIRDSLPTSFLVDEDEFIHQDTPEKKLYFEILLRAYEDATFPCHTLYKVSAVNWFLGKVIDPHVSFTETCAVLNFSPRIINVLIQEVLYGEHLSKGKTCRTRVG